MYLIQCSDGSVYTGIARDVTRRIAEHRSGGRRAARYLRGRGPLRLLAALPAGDRSEASRAEVVLKKKTAATKRSLARDPAALAGVIQAACGKTCDV